MKYFNNYLLEGTLLLTISRKQEQQYDSMRVVSLPVVV